MFLFIDIEEDNNVYSDDDNHFNRYNTDKMVQSDVNNNDIERMKCYTEDDDTEEVSILYWEDEEEEEEDEDRNQIEWEIIDNSHNSTEDLSTIIIYDDTT